MYHPAIVQLPPATLAETRLALEEVKDFTTTDMGRGGPQRWTYRILREPDLTQELARQSGASSKGRADVVSFQPCTAFDAQSQDRAIVEEWHIGGRKWLFTAVLDGESSRSHPSVRASRKIIRSLVHLRLGVFMHVLVPQDMSTMLRWNLPRKCCRESCGRACRQWP